MYLQDERAALANEKKQAEANIGKTQRADDGHLFLFLTLDNWCLMFS